MQHEGEPGNASAPVSAYAGTGTFWLWLQRTDFDLAEPSNATLGHRQVQWWNLPEGWVISKHPAHAALLSETDFIAAQDAAAPRGPAGPAARRYLCVPRCVPNARRT